MKRAPSHRWLDGAAYGLRTAAFCLIGLYGSTAAAQLDAMVPEQTPIPVEAFFEVLRDYGTWIDSDRYGTLFCPHPDVVGADFQPFSRGHWTMSALGWTFVSASKISWVTDHYGRWVEAGLPHCGWAWLPGSDWSPAWVEWRVSDRVIAWRPLPYMGPPVRMRVPREVRLSHISLPTELFSKDGRDAGFVAVNDNDFTARRVENVALVGSTLYAALRDTELLRNPRAGLHSAERQQIVARIEAKREALAQAQAAASNKATGSATGGSSGSGLPGGGAPPDPARRRKGGGAAGSTGSALNAATLRAGAPIPDAPKTGIDKAGLGLTGAKPGETPPNRTNMSTGSSAGNPGEFSGAKVLEWGGPEKKPEPKKTVKE